MSAPYLMICAAKVAHIRGIAAVARARPSAAFSPAFSTSPILRDTSGRGYVSPYGPVSVARALQASKSPTSGCESLPRIRS